LNSTSKLSIAEEREIIEGLLQTGISRRKSEEQLFNRYAYFVREAQHKYNLQQDEALDAYCEAVLSLIDEVTRSHFEGRSSLKTYLYKIFHNKCVDLLRKKTTNKSSVHHTGTITDMIHEVSDSSRSVIQQLIDRADWDKLKQKLSQLGENCRQMLMLWAEGYSDKEIAASLEYKTADVVKTSRLRCLEKLKQMYRSF
jgi:RNA polymerase sigma factor (sigma-70 family)